VGYSLVGYAHCSRAGNLWTTYEFIRELNPNPSHMGDAADRVRGHWLHDLSKEEERLGPRRLIFPHNHCPESRLLTGAVFVGPASSQRPAFDIQFRSFATVFDQTAGCDLTLLQMRNAIEIPLSAGRPACLGTSLPKRLRGAR
jgi:hypothetical protein